MLFEKGKYTDAEIALAVKTLIDYLTLRGINENEIAQKLGLIPSQISQSKSLVAKGYRSTAAYAVLYGVQLAYQIELVECINPDTQKKEFEVVSKEEETAMTDSTPLSIEDIVDAVTSATLAQLESFKTSLSTQLGDWLHNHKTTEPKEHGQAYQGHYHAYWLTVSNERSVRLRYSLHIHNKEAWIEYGNVRAHGHIEYRNHFLYIHFDDKNHIEKKRFLILYVGVGHAPSYISGLYLTTNDQLDAVSGPILLVRQSINATDDPVIIQRFFDIYYASERDRHFFFRSVSNASIHKDLQQPKNISPLEKLKGKWFIYVWAENISPQKEIFRAVMEIHSPTHLTVKGEDDLYHGIVELCGTSSNNFILRIKYNNRVARIIGHVGNLNWQTIVWIPSALCITSLTDDLPKVGLAVLKRCQDDEDFTSAYLNKDSFSANHPVHKGLQISSGITNIIAPNVLKEDI